MTGMKDLFLLSLALGIAPGAQAQNSPPEAAITVLPLAAEKDRAALWRALEAVGESTSLPVASEQTVADAIRAKCGSAPKDLIRQLVKMNPGEPDVSSEERSLRFIACPYWYFGPQGDGISIEVRKGESLPELARHFLGSSGNTTLKNLRRLNPLVFDASGHAIENGTVTVPYVARPIRLPVLRGAAQPVDSIVAALPAKAKAVTQMIGTRLGPGEYQLVAFDSVQVSDPETDCGDGYEAGRWPYNLRILADAVNAARTSLHVLPRPGLILVADTGVALSDMNIRKSLWENPNVLNGFSDSYNYRDDLHGASMVTRRGNAGDVEPPPDDYPFASHGSDIARVIAESGRREDSLLPLTRTVVARLNDPQPPYRIGVDTIPTAISYARVVGADVVNISVLIGAPSESMKSALRTSTALVVAAAGNAGRQVEALNIYPPGLSEPRERLLVVGAHDWDTRAAYFTNIGLRVDILAPGCAIPVITPDGTGRLVSGTSFAAPYVSYIAALMIAVGVPSNPFLLRNRILASGRYSPDLDGVTKYGVILDPERALRVKEDSIWLKGAERPLFGQLDSTQSWTCISAHFAESYTPATVLKVIQSSASKGVRIWLRSMDEGPFEVSECESGFSEGIAFKVTGVAEFAIYQWEEILDVVPRLQ